MTHEELLKKYNVNATEFNEQKEEIANIFLKELANMQQAEAEGLGFKSCLADFNTRWYNSERLPLRRGPTYIVSPPILSRMVPEVSFRTVSRYGNI